MKLPQISQSQNKKKNKSKLYNVKKKVKKLLHFYSICSFYGAMADIKVTECLAGFTPFSKSHKKCYTSNFEICFFLRGDIH